MPDHDDAEAWERDGSIDEPGRNAKAKSGLDRVIANTGWTDLCRMLDVKVANAITLNPACTSRPVMNAERLTAANPGPSFTARPAARPMTPT